jgi:hypothetical protein
MEFFSSFDIVEIQQARFDKLNEEFKQKYADDIAHQLKWTAAHIRSKREKIMEDLKKSVTTSSRVETTVLTIKSFNFSKLGFTKGHTRMDERGYYTATYLDYAAIKSPLAYVIGEDREYVSRWRIWKSAGFTEKLAQELDLPPTAYFKVVSKPAKEKLFVGCGDVEEYDVELVLGMRLN